MKNNVIVVIVVAIVIAVGGYLIWTTRVGEDLAETPATGETVASDGTGTVQIEAGQRPAVDFCKEKGGEIETVTAAEGVTHLCVIDGTKMEVSKYMAENKTD